MDVNNLIRALNAITEPHFTNGGHHKFTGEPSLDGTVLAAWYARNALYEAHHRSVTDRVCDLLRAKEEIGKVHQGSIMSGEHSRITASELSNVLNAIAYATSLVCDEIRALELVKAKPGRKGV